MNDMPKEIWAYMDCGNGALWHEPTHPADQDAIKYIRADHHTAEIAKRDRAIKYALEWFEHAMKGNILSAPDAGLVMRKLQEAILGEQNDPDR